MKKLATLIAFSLLLNMNGVLSQSFHILGGIGLHPKGPTWPVTFLTCCSYCPQDVASDKIVKYTSSPGYSIFAGIGKEINIKDNWSFTVNGRFQYLKIPSAEQYWVQERHLDKELLSEGQTKYNLENLHLQAALSLQRKINIGKLETEVFGGGFGRLRLYESLVLHASETHYYTDIISGLAVNENTGEEYGVVVSKRKLEPPLKHFYSDKPSGNLYRPLHYGLLAGFNINLLSSSKGLLKGQLIFNHDLNTLFRHDFERPNYHLNSVTVGIIYYPLKSQKSEKDIDIIEDQPAVIVEEENPDDSLNYI
ncbi:MAG: hypothetical protein IPM82_25190, partial [Saprospiraceae bacterium]|nr:hypothetical protein [Saprospiraceae bacterium]